RILLRENAAATRQQRGIDQADTEREDENRRERMVGPHVARFRRHHGPRPLGFHRLAAQLFVPLLRRLSRHKLAAGELGEVTAEPHELVEGAGFDYAASLAHPE